jgi:serine protease Do
MQSRRTRRRSWTHILRAGLAAGLLVATCSPVTEAVEAQSAPGRMVAQAAGGSPPGPNPSSVSVTPQVSDALMKRIAANAVAVVTVKGAGVDRRTQQSGTVPQLLGQLFPREFPTSAPRPDITGSGFVVDSSGYVVSNHHVVDGATDIQVTLSDGRLAPAQLVRSDPANDLALLKIAATGLKAIPLGATAGLKEGQLVVALGRRSPDRDLSVTVGSITSVGAGIGTDVAIGRDTSGGPLMNSRGEAVGITTALTTQGSDNRPTGAAAAVDTAGSILQQFMTASRAPAPPTGVTTGATLGISTQTLTPELARTLGVSSPQGVLVTAVDPASAGAAAGLKPGDVIARFDGRTVGTPEELSTRLASATAGKAVDLQIVRDRKARTLRATLADPGDAAEVEAQSDTRSAVNRWGVELRRLTPWLARRLGVPNEDGVVVTQVRPDSPGARAGISAGDMIREVNRISVNALQDIEESTSAGGSGQEEVLVRIERKGSPRYVVVKPG